MANVDIDVGGKSLNVDIDGLENQSPDQQAATVNQVAAHLAPSYMGDLQGGAHDLGTSLSQTASALGAPSVASAIDQYTPNAPANDSTADLTSAVRAGDWRGGLAALPHAALRGAVSAAPILAGGAVGGPLLAGAAAGAEALGPTAYQRAANNNRTEPTTGDVLGALPSTALQAGLGAVLPGGAAAGIESTAGRLAAKAGIEAGTGMGMAAAGQLGGSVGTDAGAKLDPAELASVGLTQAAIGAARGAPELARVGLQSAANEAMVRSQPEQSPDQQASAQRVVKMMQEASADVTARDGKAPTDQTTANMVKANIAGQASSYTAELADAGLIDSQLRQRINELFQKQALRHNNDTGTGDDPATLMGMIKAAPLPPEVLAPLLQGATDLNTLAGNSFQKNGQGPLRLAGQFLGNAGSLLGAALSMNPHAMIGAAMGHGYAGKVLGAAGGVMDRVMGTNAAPVTFQAQAGERAGTAPGENTLTMLQNARTALAGAQQSQPSPSAPENLPFNVGSPVPDPIADAAARSKAWQKVQGKPTSQSDPQDAWAALDAAQSAMNLQKQKFQAGVQLPGQTADPLSGVPTETPGMPTDPQAQADLDAQAQAATTANALSRQRATDLANRIAQRKFDSTTVDSLAQAKVDKLSKGFSVDLAAADKLPTETPELAQEAGTAATITALKQAQRVMGLAASASPELSDRLATGLPAGDLARGVNGAAFQTPQARAPAALQTAPMAPLAAPSPGPATPLAEGTPGPSVGLPEAPMSLPASQGRGWERYVAQRAPGASRADVHAAVDAVHSPELASQIKSAQGGLDPALLRPVQDHLNSQEPVTPIQDRAKWDAGAASYQQNGAQLRSEMAAVGLPTDLIAAHQEVTSTPGQDAKSALRDAALAKHGPEVAAAAKRFFNSRVMKHGPKHARKV